MNWKDGQIRIGVSSPGPLVVLTLADTITGVPLCRIEMQPEEFALAITRNGERRCKYLDIYVSREEPA